MNNLNYIVIDFETANWKRNSACAVGLVRFINGIEKDSVSSLIKPPTKYFVQEWTETIHGISFNTVRNKPKFPDIWNNLILPFINKTPDFPLVAHNATFDMSVIKGCCEYYKIPVPHFQYFDSLQIARHTWPELNSHKLTFLGEYFNIKYKAHDALEDSKTCGKIVSLAANKWCTSSLIMLMKKCNTSIKTLI